MKKKHQKRKQKYKERGEGTRGVEEGEDRKGKTNLPNQGKWEDSNYSIGGHAYICFRLLLILLISKGI